MIYSYINSYNNSFVFCNCINIVGHLSIQPTTELFVYTCYASVLFKILTTFSDFPNCYTGKVDEKFCLSKATIYAL